MLGFSRGGSRGTALGLASFRPLSSHKNRGSSNMSAAPNGQPITMGQGNKLEVPDNPIIPFIEGDGTGRDIWRASVRVFDAAVEKAYGGKRKIHWMEVYAGEKPFKLWQSWLPDETTE